MTVQDFAVAGMSCEHGVVRVMADRRMGTADAAAAVDEAGYELVPGGAGGDRWA
jgi:hypothetical protein